MTEHIRYAVGHSSLGEFLVASSEHGLVVFEFVDEKGRRVERLRERFPDAKVAEDAAGLQDILATLSEAVDHPERPCPLPLDIRGTDFQKRVWEILRRIPAGETTHMARSPPNSARTMRATPPTRSPITRSRS
jgi:AraC family transcriptional regulator of adaptative response/methylated-DNA-[protein]-cysteine methyltransferase